MKTPGEALFQARYALALRMGALNEWKDQPEYKREQWENFAAHAIAAWYNLQNEPIPPCQPIGCDHDMHQPYCPLGLDVL